MADPKALRLQQIPMFKHANKTALAHLASATDETTVPAGRVLITEGRHHNELFIIQEGTASVKIDGNVVAEIPAGEMVGELGFFVRQTASATVEAITDMAVLIIPYNRFDQILNDNPELVRAIANELAERLYETDAKLQ